MTNQHQITPPSELLEQWVNTAQKREGPLAYTKSIALQAAQWGADQELEACCMWITREKSVIMAEQLGNVRRPKPPSLKKQALYALDEAESSDCLHLNGLGDTIRRALETLDD